MYLLSLSSCDGSVSPHKNDLSIELISKNEELSIDENIELILHNGTNSTLYLEFCGPNMLYSIERKEEGEWIHYSGGICLDLYVPEFIPAVGPGKSKTISLKITSSGIYRIILPYKLNSETEVQIIEFKFAVA